MNILVILDSVNLKIRILSELQPYQIYILLYVVYQIYDILTNICYLNKYMIS